MKLKLIISAIIILGIAFIIFGYINEDSEARLYEHKIRSAQVDLVLAQQRLARAQLDASRRLFNSITGQLDSNEKQIINLRNSVKASTWIERKKNEELLNELLKTNNELRIKIRESQNNQDKWLSYTADLEDLSRALSDFAMEMNP